MTEDGKKMTENDQKILYSNFLGVLEINGKWGTRVMHVILWLFSVILILGILGILRFFMTGIDGKMMGT